MAAIPTSMRQPPPSWPDNPLRAQSQSLQILSQSAAVPVHVAKESRPDKRRPRHWARLLSVDQIAPAFHAFDDQTLASMGA
ncbi:MAG: hypothetical protein EA407_05100 [Rhodobacteraceae bacterium]|nr:MAG: hypothetical protein EA407_05100 [Paracoccaceae bacterium]